MLKRKDKILISAIELLGREGINGVTIKNLADEQAVSEPAIYRQYKNKKEIILSIIEEYESYDQQIQKTITQSSLTGKEAILFYVARYAELYENYYELTTVMLSMDLFYYEEAAREIMHKITMKRKNFFRSLVEAYAQDEKKTFWEDDVVLCTCIEGIMMKEIMDWRLHDRSYPLKDKILTTINKII